jgi:photosystem II stability/assembly factor-like uncharacterized protein
MDFNRNFLAAALCFLLAGLPTACAGPVRSAPSLDWQPRNDGLLTHAPVLALAFDPVNPQVLYVGTGDPAGLYRSEDGGQTWHPANDGLQGRPVHALLADPGRPGHLLAGTSNGLFATVASGRSWQPIPDLPWPLVVYALARDQDGTLYLAGDRPQPYRSDDGGQTWRPLAPLAGGSTILSLAVSTDGGLLLVGTDEAGLFLSRDRGQTWQVAAEIGRTTVAGLWLGDRQGHTAYARTRRGLFRSDDRGETRRPLAAGIEERIDALALDPAAGWVYLATNHGRIFRGRHGEDSWLPWGEGWGGRRIVFTLRQAPDDPRVLYAGVEPGLYRSTDGGLSWQLLQGGLGMPQATALAQAPEGTLYLANADGVYVSKDAGERWVRLGRGLPAVPVLSVAVSPADPLVLYAGTDGHGLYRSNDGGQTWTPTALPVPAVPALLLHPADPRRVYARAAFQRVYESRDGGQTWTTPWEGMDLTTEVISLALDPQQPEVLYAGGTEALFKSTDGAGSWQRIAPELAGQTVFAVVVDPADSNVLYAGATRGVYRSADGGQSWQRLGSGAGVTLLRQGSGMEEITVTALAFHPGGRKGTFALRQSQVLYAGTKYHGVYRSDDGGDGLGQTSVNALLVSTDGRWLFAATPEGFYRAAAR